MHTNLVPGYQNGNSHNLTKWKFSRFIHSLKCYHNFAIPRPHLLYENR